MEEKEAFGIVLRRLREKKGITQEQLAFRCNLHRTYIGLLERGLRQPTISTIFSIGKELKIKPSTIIKLTEQEMVKKPSGE
ncbi:XRE family transcriptional regulator [Pseudoalteromonas gelatinilytica]|uniref:XRE family transcriptional regulator n=1 Tax=Pseudoalteromonas gelatinilytica TaxID=1703256 RepID=A0A3A3EGK6_9GAMM|nr:helix-turn-helix transcriptional regulator [Pseudoalteromonas profundi]RJF32057.1 XRE family transcriptional regulator [Pseudoalteromonas profundi]